MPKLQKIAPSSPECDSCKTIVTTAVIEPLPKQVQSKEITAGITISKTLNERKNIKKNANMNYDTIEEANSPETKQRYGKAPEISLPRSITQVKKDVDCNLTRNYHSTVANKELTTKATNVILQEIRNSKTSPTINGFIEEGNGLKCGERAKINKSSETGQKENCTPKIIQHGKKLTKTKATKTANMPKLKRTRKAVVRQNINTDINDATSTSDENISSSLIQNQNTSRYDQLMDSFMKKASENDTNVSGKRQKSDRNAALTRSNNQIYNTITSMDIVMRDTAGYESQYSDGNSPERVKQKIKTANRGVNRLQPKTSKTIHTVKNKLPEKNLKAMSPKYMKHSTKRSTVSSSPSLASLYSEKEARKAKMLEIALTDTDSNNEEQSAICSIQSNVLTEVISIQPGSPIITQARTLKCLNKSSAIIPPLHPEPFVTHSKSVTSTDDILENVGDVFRHEIMKPTLLSHDQNLSMVSENPADVNPGNVQINSWIATGLPVDAVQHFKSMAEVVLQSYTMIIRTHLQSLRAGPLHPDLTRIYDTFMKLDNELQNYFEKQ